jgi:hypothetical protein
MNTSAQRLLVLVGAPVAALSVWALAVPLGGVDLAVRSGDGTRTVGPVPVVTASLLAALAGVILLAVLDRRSTRPRRVWTMVALGVLPTSFVGPLDSAAGVTAALVLILMHLVVGTVVIAGLARR